MLALSVSRTSGGHKGAPTKRGLKCHLPEGNPSLARRVALTMRAFAARVTRFFGRSTNRPVVSPDPCEARGGGWMAHLFARVKSFPASPAVSRVLSLWQQTPAPIQNDSGLHVVTSWNGTRRSILPDASTRGLRSTLPLRGVHSWIREAKCLGPSAGECLHGRLGDFVSIAVAERRRNAGRSLRWGV